MKKNYNGIDLFKFIMAFLVVAIHLTPMNMFGKEANQWAQVFTRVAVPFFFCASGFFLRLKLDSNRRNYSNIIISYSKRILLLYLIWTVIYIPCIIFWFVKDKKTILSFIQECIFDGSYLHLWYLPALVVSSLLVSVLYRKIGIKRTIIIAFFLFVIGMFDSSWYYLFSNSTIRGILQNYDKVFITSRNGVFFGFIFVALGFLSVEFNVRLKHAVLGVIISFICLFIEMRIYYIYDISRSSQSVLFSIPLAFFVFQLAKNIKLLDRPIYGTLRHMGVLIYFGHCWVDFIFSILIYNILHTSSNSMTRYLFTAVIMTVLAFVITKLQKKEKMKWLNKLY